MNKHSDDYVFGMDREQQDRWRAKYDPEREKACQVWLEELLGKPFPDPDFETSLQNGVLLGKAVNIIGKCDPNYVKMKVSKRNVDPTKKTHATNCRENIEQYLQKCVSLGMKPTDCFTAVDLFDKQNKVCVIDQIYALGSITQTLPGYTGPKFGVKQSEENKRTFTAEQIAASKKIVPLQNAGSIAVEKSKGTDAIVMYGKAGVELGESTGGVSQQNAGSITVEKSKGTDHIVKYGMVGQEMGESVGGVSQQNAGSIAVEKSKGTDHIVKYGKVGQEMGESAGGVSQQNAGSIAVEKEIGTDHIVMYGKTGQELGESAGGVSQQNAGSITTDKSGNLDSVSRALN